MSGSVAVTLTVDMNRSGQEQAEADHALMFRLEQIIDPRKPRQWLAESGHCDQHHEIERNRVVLAPACHECQHERTSEEQPEIV